MSVMRALLAAVVDYACLFPPAALDMATAVRNYADYRASDDAWMLGRFVVPVSRLEEFRAALDSLGRTAGPEWRLSALVGSDVPAELERARAFNRGMNGRAAIDSLEGRAGDASTVEALAAARSEF